MDTKLLLKITEDMISKTETIDKNKKAVKEILELNKRFQSELEK